MYNTHKSIYILDNWFVSMGGYTKKKWGFSIPKSKQTSYALQHNYALTKTIQIYENIQIWSKLKILNLKPRV
jgi:hypothetical protein